MFCEYLLQLNSLYLSDTKITQTDIELLGRISLLEELGLEETSIKNLNEVVPKLHNLIHLYVDDTDLDDSLIESLQGKNMCSLSIERTRVSGKSVERIKKLGLEYFVAEENSDLTLDQICDIEDHLRD